jgi:AcrR family transcriptional regulator
MKKRITKKSWLVEGLDVLANLGAEKLTIDTLCSQLGVTKGSFYHHFKNRENFIENLLVYWEEVNTLAVIKLSEGLGDTRERIKEITSIAIASMSSSLEVSIRAWALKNNKARRFQERVDQARLDYARKLWAELLGNGEEAELVSRLYYSTFVGCQEIMPPFPEKEVYAMFDLFLEKVTA